MVPFAATSTLSNETTRCANEVSSELSVLSQICRLSVSSAWMVRLPAPWVLPIQDRRSALPVSGHLAITGTRARLTSYTANSSLPFCFFASEVKSLLAGPPAGKRAHAATIRHKNAARKKRRIRVIKEPARSLRIYGVFFMRR